MSAPPPPYGGKGFKERTQLSIHFIEPPIPPHDVEAECESAESVPRRFPHRPSTFEPKMTCSRSAITLCPHSPVLPSLGRLCQRSPSPLAGCVQPDTPIPAVGKPPQRRLLGRRTSVYVGVTSPTGAHDNLQPALSFLLRAHHVMAGRGMSNSKTGGGADGAVNSL